MRRRMRTVARQQLRQGEEGKGRLDFRLYHTRPRPCLTCVVVWWWCMQYGGDMAIVLHPYPHIQGARPVGGGIYYGGEQAGPPVQGP